jgi:hypothetical protein
MQMRAAIICVVLAACVASGSLLFAREPEGPAAVTAEQLIAQALAGEAGKEVNAQLYTFPPGTVLPCHSRPAHFRRLSTGTHSPQILAIAGELNTCPTPGI